MSKNLVTLNNSMSDKYIPVNLADLEKLAIVMSKSGVVPKSYIGKSADILACFLHGSEIGYRPMQSLINIAMINGRPCLYGDAMKALVLSSPLCVSIIETEIGEVGKDTWGYKCTVVRRGQSPASYKFTVSDAKVGMLWSKPGPWSTYPQRMLMFRARSFCLRDNFPDVLAGIASAEEQLDIIDLKKMGNEQYAMEEKEDVKYIAEKNVAVVDDVSKPHTNLSDHDKWDEIKEYFAFHPQKIEIFKKSNIDELALVAIEHFDWIYKKIKEWEGITDEKEDDTSSS